MLSPKQCIGAMVEIDAISPRIHLQGDAHARCEALGQDAKVEAADFWPGERARARILARSRHAPRYFAKIDTLLEEHPERVDPPCVHHPGRGAKPACGGCPWMTLDLPEQRRLKSEILGKIFGRPVPMLTRSPGQGYRHSSKRVVGRIRGRLSLGSYIPKSHDLASMHNCVVDHPLLTQAFKLSEELFIEHRVAPYDEGTKSGELRYLWAKCNHEALHLTAIGAHPRSEGLQRALEALAERLGPKSAVSWQLQSTQGNAIRSDNPIEMIAGPSELPTLSMLGQALPLDALGFLQPNPKVAQDCYRALLALDEDPAPQGALAFDLYAGAGATSQALAQRYREVLACEIRPPHGAADCVQSMSTEDFLAAQLRNSRTRPDFVCANPPRSGLSEQACASLLELQSPRLAIMSCGPKGLADNIDTLRGGGYELCSLQAFDPLAHTAHVELVAHLRFRAS